MDMYWRLQDIPELKSLGKADRAELYVSTAPKRFRDPVMLLALIPLFVIVAIGCYIGQHVLPWRYGIAIGGGVGAAVANGLIEILWINRCRSYLAGEARLRSRS